MSVQHCRLRREQHSLLEAVSPSPQPHTMAVCEAESSQLAKARQSSSDGFGGSSLGFISEPYSC